MHFPPEVLKAVHLYHLPTTAGSTQSYPSSPSVSVQGAFLPLDRRERAMEGGLDMVIPFELYLEPGVDVRVGDKLVTDGVNYYVKYVFVADFGGLPHKRVSLSTQD